MVEEPDCQAHANNFPPGQVMRDLVVDLTPTCVNKTAIRHIALDTLDALRSSFRTSLQYRGIRSEQMADNSQEVLVAASFREDMAQWARHAIGATDLPSRDGDRTPRLYFDPIYTLYRQLEPHDVVFVLDVSPLTDPEWHAPAVSDAYAKAFGHVMRSRAKIVCISAHCATSLRSAFAISAAEITTVPLYLRAFPEAARAAPKLGASLEKERFLLFVGSLETRKNLVGLMRAFALSGLAGAGWRLVCAGGNGHGADTILEVAGDLEGVEMLGFVSDHELEWLYRNADGFAYPSFLEGFGLPLLEAMSFGLWCLASTTGASTEVCGDLATLVDPYDVPAIAQGLRSCAARSEKVANEEIRSRANQFTFQKYVDALMPFIQQAAA